MSKCEIIPAILPKTFSEIGQKLGMIIGASFEVQIDITDGRYTPNKTWPYVGDSGEFGRLVAEKEGLPFWQDVDYEFDLMVLEPEKLISDYVKMGGGRVIIHIGSLGADKLSDLIREWKHAVEIGLAIRPRDPLSLLETFIHEVNFVQFMGNDKIGFQGVSLDEKVYGKIRNVRNKHPSIDISVDIGVNFDTAPKLIECGATRLAAGSVIFGSDDPLWTYKRLSKLGQFRGFQ